MSYNLPPLHTFTNSSDVSEGDIEVSDVDVAENGLAGIGDILNGLYTKPIFAVIREYLMNAVDAHNHSGTSEPVRLYAGSKQPFQTYDGKFLYDKTFFVITDCGYGMTLEEMKMYFAKYGGSTKGKDRKVVGKFGVGAKSALSVTAYFEIISVKDGMKTVAVIHKDAVTSLSRLHVKEHAPTEEASGTTIKIPVPYDFLKYGYENYTDFVTLLWTFPNGSILLNDQTVADTGKFLNEDNYLVVTSVTGEPVAWISILRKNLDNRILRSRWEKKKPNIIMGGVPYSYTESNWVGSIVDSVGKTKVPKIISDMEMLGYEIYLNLPPKSLQLTPNREEVKIIPENTQYVIEAYEDLVKFIQPVFSARLNSLEEKEAYFFRGFNAYPLNPNLSLEGSYRYDPHENDNFPTPEYYYRGKLMHNDINLEDFFDRKEIFLSGRMKHKVQLVNFAGNRPPWSTVYKNEYNARVSFNLFVYGKYTGRVKDPIAAYTKNALKQLGFHVSKEPINVAYVNSDKPFPQDYVNTGLILSINQLQELASQWREDNYKKPVREPVSKEKSVANSYYIVLGTNEENVSTVQLWHKSDVKAYTGKVYYLEERVHENMFNRNSLHRGYNWDDLRKTFTSFEETTDIPAHFVDYGEAVKSLDGVLVLVPKNKSLNAFLTANDRAEELFVPLPELGKERWNFASDRDKKMFALWVLLDNKNATRILVRNKSWVDANNSYLKELFEVFTDKNSDLYRNFILFSSVDFNASSHKMIRDHVPLFYQYWHETDNPSIALLDAIANISELKD